MEQKGANGMQEKTMSARRALVFRSASEHVYRHLASLSLLLALSVPAPRPPPPQATTSIRGTVPDPDGNAVVGANVVLADDESKTERSATTGGQGEYQFLLI